MKQRHGSTPNSLAPKAQKGTCIFLLLKSKRTYIKVVTPASANESDLPQRQGALCHIPCREWGSLRTQSNNWWRLEPCSALPLGFVKGFRAVGRPSSSAHLGCVLRKGRACGVHSSSRTGLGWEAAWGQQKVSATEVLPVTKPPVTKALMREGKWWEGWHRKAVQRKTLWSSIEDTENEKCAFFPSNLTLWNTQSVHIFPINYPFLLCQLPLRFTSHYQALLWELLFNISTTDYQSETKQTQFLPSCKSTRAFYWR